MIPILCLASTDDGDIHHVFLHEDEAFHTRASVGCEIPVLSTLSP